MGEKCHVRSLSIEYKLKLHTHFFINAREYWGQIYASRPVLTRWLNWRARRLIRSKEVPPPSSHYVTRCHCFSAVSAAGRRCAVSGVLFAAVPVGLVCCRCADAFNYLHPHRNKLQFSRRLFGPCQGGPNECSGTLS